MNLLHGSYLIGRGPQCHVVLDDPRISRTHARVLVDGGGASIEDCGSVNGVYVNGERITGIVRLETGDSVVIGAHQLLFELTDAEAAPHRAVTDTLPEPGTVPPPRAAAGVTSGSRATGTGTGTATSAGVSTAASADSERRQAETQSPEGFPAEQSYSTARANALELLGGVAERALAAGDAVQAEAMIRARLLEVLDVVRARQPMPPDVAARALRLALDLGQQLKATRWLDYALDLLTALAAPCPADVVRQMRAVRAAGGPPDPARLAAYGRCVRALPMSLDKVRTVALLDELGG